MDYIYMFSAALGGSICVGGLPAPCMSSPGYLALFAGAWSGQTVILDALPTCFDFPGKLLVLGTSGMAACLPHACLVWGS